MKPLLMPNLWVSPYLLMITGDWPGVKIHLLLNNKVYGGFSLFAPFQQLQK